MTTSVYEIKLNDGRTFRVFAGNSSQKNRFLAAFNCVPEKYNATISIIVDGIHTVKQWESLTKKLF